MDLVDIVVDALVHRLDAARHDDLPVELACVIPADQRLELSDELARFPVRNKFCRLHRVHQQLELRQLEIPAAEVIVVVAALLLADYVKTEFSQLVKILVQRLPVRVDTVTAEHRDYLRHRERVIVVSLLREDLHQIEHLELLVVTSAFSSHLYDTSVSASYCIKKRRFQKEPSPLS